MKLSVFIITKNEEKNIGACLESAAWADEIVVVDSGSTDKTRDIVSRHTPHFFTHEFKDYSSQKNFALSKTSGDWVLSLDADERVSEALQKEIKKTVSSPNPAEGYQIHRESLIFGRLFRYTGTQDDKPVRLFKKKSGEFRQPIHEAVAIQGRVGELKGTIRHNTYTSVHDYFDRLNRYTGMEAEYFVQKKLIWNKKKCTAKPLAMFFCLYVWKRGFMDGVEGFLFSVLSAYYVFIKHAKHFESSREPR